VRERYDGTARGECDEQQAVKLVERYRNPVLGSKSSISSVKMPPNFERTSPQLLFQYDIVWVIPQNGI
jgi:hypothetical protein